jgi:hypothetical protein
VGATPASDRTPGCGVGTGLHCSPYPGLGVVWSESPAPGYSWDCGSIDNDGAGASCGLPTDFALQQQGGDQQGLSAWHAPGTLPAFSPGASPQPFVMPGAEDQGGSLPVLYGMVIRQRQGSLGRLGRRRSGDVVGGRGKRGKRHGHRAQGHTPIQGACLAADASAQQEHQHLTEASGATSFVTDPLDQLLSTWNTKWTGRDRTQGN